MDNKTPISAWFMMAIFLGGIGAVTLSQASLIRIESKMASMQAFHSPALSTIQNIQSKFVEAVEESFAYVISGETAEKQDFEYWVRSSRETDRKFARFAKLDDPEKAELKASYDQFLALREELQHGAEQMFLDYEATGAVSHETFMNYEHSIDNIDLLLDDLVALQKENVEQHYASSMNLVSQGGLVLTVIGAVVMLVAGFIGIMAGRQMNSNDSRDDEQSDSPVKMMGDPRASPRTNLQSDDKASKNSAVA